MLKEGIAWFPQIHKTNATVTAASPSAPLAASYTISSPTAWTAGQPQSSLSLLGALPFSIWNAAGSDRVRLGVHFGTASDKPHDGWATDQRFNLPLDVAPGSSVTFTITVTAPGAPGSFVLRHRMLKEGIAWFPQIHKTNATVTAASTSAPLAASYTISPPTAWTAGQPQSYSVTMTNTGSQAWNAAGTNIVRLGVHFGTS